MELNKFNALKLLWYIRKSKFIANDFIFENIDQVIEFVNIVLNRAKEVNYIPDIVIHKRTHVRIELYNKEVGGFGSQELDFAKDIENIYIEKYKHE
ncbi:4a-hydroxytetrahydrobiopterin dehydratase [Candidatus Dojkabacteria bacterium]|nr:4a-hydroxytetrahydrobiopterin dehydratase [Candidatus Dojkabacteria bacterium]